MTEELRQKITGVAFLLLLVTVLAPWVISLIEVSPVKPSIALEKPSTLAKIAVNDHSVDSADIHLHQKTKAKVLGGVHSHELYRSQVASFINPHNAKQLCLSLTKQGVPCQVDQQQSWSRVYVGPMSDRMRCKKLASIVAKRQNNKIEKVTT